MASIGISDTESVKQLEARYARILRATLRAVFKADQGLVEGYLQRLAEADPLEQLLALNGDPLDVAGSLAGVAITAEHRAAYSQLGKFEAGSSGAGRSETPSPVIGKHSGLHDFIHKLEQLGYELGSNQLEDAFVRMKALADRKKDIYDEDIEALVDQEIASAHNHIKLASLTVLAGTHGPQRATMKLSIGGQHKIEEAEGNGPVDAIFNCIRALVPHEAKLELYQVHAVTEGADAQAEVSVRLAHEGRSITARAADTDTLVASAKAYLGALNKIVMERQRDLPGPVAAR